MVKMAIDGREVEVEPGVTVLQACQSIGIEIPPFCSHQRLSIPCNFRMFLVEMEKSPQPLAPSPRAWHVPWECAERTIKCAAGLDPPATGLAGERGLMQIAFVHIARIQRLGFTWAQMYEVGPNLAVSYSLWQEQGETPWEGTSDCRGD